MPRTIPLKETLTVEFKSDIKKYGDSNLFEDVVAFANTDGGDLYLGVEDDGTITGVHKDHSNPITLSAYIANNTVPPISTRTEIIEEERPVLKISVPKSYGGIAATRSGKMMRRRMKSDNTPENVPMYPTEIATRLSDLRLLDYSAMIVFDGSPEDIDPLEIERLRTIILSYDGDKALLELSDGELLKALGFTREQNGVVYPTVAGLLMVGRVLSIKRVRVNEDYMLPVLACIEKIISLMEAWNPECEIELGLFRMPAPEFDKRAFREAVVNAFSHRDYSIMGRVRVAVTEDGLTIANPGGLIEGVTVRNLLTVEPHGRNQLLADALKRVGLAEKTGRGIDRIFEGSLIYGRGFPDYSNTTSTVVSLFIPRSKPDAQLTKMIAEEHNRLGRPLPINTLMVLNMLRDSPRSDVKQLSEALNLSETMIKAILDRAIETGLVEGYGAGRGRNYSLSHELYRDKEKTVGYVRQRDIDEARHQELIISMARSSEYISRADVVNLLHVKESKAYGLLKALVEQGVLAPVNKGRYAKYRLIR